MLIAVDIRCLASPLRTGVAEYTYELLTALFSVDHSNRYILFYNSFKDASKYLPAWNYENVECVAANIPNKLLHGSIAVSGRPYLDRFLESKIKRKIDCIFFPNLDFSSWSRTAKVILTVHDLSFELLPHCFTLKQEWRHKIIKPRAQCLKADKILVPSENTKQDLLTQYALEADKIRVLYPGLSSSMRQGEANLEAVKKTYALPEKYLLFLGTLEPRKNIQAVVKGFELSKLADRSYHLIIAGPEGWKMEPIHHAMTGVRHVRYIGYVKHEDKFALYKLAQMFVYPSLYEGFGFPVLEALSLGLPVITSNRSSLPELVSDAAYLVNPYNVSELAHAMKCLADDENIRAYYSEKALARSTLFSWQKAALEFLSIISETRSF